MKMDIRKGAANGYSADGDTVLREIEEAALAFDRVRDRLWVQLVGRSNPLVQSKKYPYKKVEGIDLVTIYRVREEYGKPYRGDPVVDNAMLRKWRVDPHCLDWIALKSTMRQMPVRITTLNDLFRKDIKTVAPEEMYCESGMDYILTNPEISYGAVTFQYPGVLQALAENSGSDLYLLPFSPHAVAVRRADSGTEVKKLQHLLLIINTTKEPPGEILSNHIYRYDGKEQKLSCATTEEETEEMLKEVLAGRERLSEQEKLDEELER